MVYIKLFLSFLRIGFTSFGGISMIPMIFAEMEMHHWMSADDLSILIGIAEMTPGPLGVNCATFAGTKAAGFWGGIVAVLGVLTPTFTLTMTAAFFFQKFRKSTMMTTILQFVKPICIALILQVIVTLCIQNFISESGAIDLYGIMIAAAAFYFIHYRRWSVPKVILGAAVMGIFCFGIL